METHTKKTKLKLLDLSHELLLFIIPILFTLVIAIAYHGELYAQSSETEKEAIEILKIEDANMNNRQHQDQYAQPPAFLRYIKK